MTTTCPIEDMAFQPRETASVIEPSSVSAMERGTRSATMSQIANNQA